MTNYEVYSSPVPPNSEQLTVAADSRQTINSVALLKPQPNITNEIQNNSADSGANMDFGNIEIFDSKAKAKGEDLSVNEQASFKPPWCAPPAEIADLPTGDKYIFQLTGPNSFEQVLRTPDESEFSFYSSALSGELFARFRTPDNVQIHWSGSNAEVTLPDGTKFTPRFQNGNLNIEHNGRSVMTVSCQDGRTCISQPNGHSFTFDRDGLIAVSTNSDGVIRHQNIRNFGGGKVGGKRPS